MTKEDLRFLLSAPRDSLSPSQKAQQSMILRALNKAPAIDAPRATMRTTPPVTPEAYESRVAQSKLTKAHRLSFASSRAILMLSPLHCDHAPFAYDHAIRAALATPLRASKANNVEVTLRPAIAAPLYVDESRRVKLTEQRAPRVNAFDAYPIAPRQVPLRRVDSAPLIDAYLSEHKVTRVAPQCHTAQKTIAARILAEYAALTD